VGSGGREDDAPEREKTLQAASARVSFPREATGKATKRRPMGTIVQFSNQVGFRDCLPTREDREKAIEM
jgi:hypothetical protein